MALVNGSALGAPEARLGGLSASLRIWQVRVLALLAAWQCWPVIEGGRPYFAAAEGVWKADAGVPRGGMVEVIAIGGCHD